MDVVPGDKFFMYISNHHDDEDGQASTISITLDKQQLVEPLQQILTKGGEILLFASTCDSKASFTTRFCEGSSKEKISIVYDDPGDTTKSTSANVVLKRMPRTVIGTEFCHLLLSVLSDMKKMDNTTISDLLEMIHSQTKAKFVFSLGSNSNTPISEFFGDVSSYVSPLVRSAEVLITRITPYNGELDSHPDILATLQELAQTALGRAITNEEYNAVDIEAVVDAHHSELMAISRVCYNSSNSCDVYCCIF